MLAKKFKIGGKFKIEKILKKGGRIKGRLLQCKFLPNRSNHHRFCIVTSKNLSAKAVDRNRVKRRIYEVIRLQNLSASKLGACKDIVIIPFKIILKSPFLKIESDLKYCINKFSHE